MTSIKNLPAHERPREKLIARGVENLSDKELLAILLRTGRAGKSALDIAAGILEKFPKKKILDVTFADLKAIKGLDAGKACTLLAAFEFTKRASGAHKNGRPVIVSVDDALAQLHDIRTHKKEHFVALYLNARNELIHREDISVGTVNASIVHPRDVFAPALEHNATTVIVAHNHPSGSPDPSPEDFDVTGRLKDAAKLMGIHLLYHLIVTKDRHASIHQNP